MDRRDMVMGFTELKTFSHALRAAIYDKQLEKSRTLRYYHDADVIVKIVLGFRQYDETRTSSTDKQKMVRALLSSGYLGKAYLLRPHALELDQQIRGQPAYQTRAAVEAFTERRRQFLVHSEVDEVMGTLHDILERPNPQEVKATQFIDRLRTVAPKTWVAIELARGTWKERLKQLSRYDVIRFDARGLDAGTVLQGEPFRTFHAVLRERRADSTLSNVHDAAALSLLHRDIQSENGENIVRFYTETKVVAELWDDKRVKSFLNYGNGEDGVDAAVRDADYFVVRANFDALRFGDLKMAEFPHNGQTSVSIDELKRVSEELLKIEASGEAHSETAIRQLYIGEKPLTDTLNELQSLSFVRNVWFQYKPPDLLIEPELWSEVWSFSDDVSATNVLDTELEKVRDKLREEVTQMERWSQNFRDVLSRVGTLKDGWRPQLSPEPMRDLGVIRWGLELAPAECERLNHHIVDLMSEQEVREQASATIASLVESAPPSASDTVVTVCVLWFLRLFPAVIDIIDYHERAVRGPVMHSLRIIRAAARLRGATVRDRPQIDKLIAEVTEICNSAGDDLRKNLLLGCGFVLYYAWLSERDRPAPNQDRLNELARRSFACGEEAVTLLGDSTLARAFAMNHCAYVGTVTEIERDKTTDYITRLIDLRGTESWHYRFADTLAWHHIMLARKELADVRKFGLRSKRKRQVCNRLHEAEKLYNEDLGDIFGDVEIIGHRPSSEISSWRRNAESPSQGI